MSEVGGPERAASFLYYAGMGIDKEHEQIGLAISDDGPSYRRAGNDGLVLRRDPALEWKDSKVCNPTVLRRNGRYLMFHQGISRRNANTSIGLAVSTDGIRFDAPSDPCLGWAEMRRVDPALDDQATVRVLEPSVLAEDEREGGRLRMWFIYIHASHPGNALFYAESGDAGKSWDVHDRPQLRGAAFGDYQIHYPQILRVHDGYQLWFSLRRRQNGRFGIFRMRSDDGLAWVDVRQVLPCSRGGAIRLGRLDALRFALRQNGWMGLRANDLGVAHPHVVGEASARVLYYHNVTRGARGRLLTIGRAALDGDRLRDPRVVLRPAEDPNAWDAYFVGDPYVLRVGAAGAA